MIIPSLYEFENYLNNVQKLIQDEVEQYVTNELNRLNLPTGSLIPGACSVGSTKIFIDKRSKLAKFLLSIPYVPHKNYFVSEGNYGFHLTLRNIGSINYMENKLANELLAKYIRQEFGWEIYSDVNID